MPRREAAHVGAAAAGVDVRRKGGQVLAADDGEGDTHAYEASKLEGKQHPLAAARAEQVGGELVVARHALDAAAAAAAAKARL